MKASPVLSLRLVDLPQLGVLGLGGRRPVVGRLRILRLAALRVSSGRIPGLGPYFVSVMIGIRVMVQSLFRFSGYLGSDAGMLAAACLDGLGWMLGPGGRVHCVGRVEDGSQYSC